MGSYVLANHSYVGRIFCQEFLYWHNVHRQMHGVPELKWSKRLTQFAEQIVKDLAERNIPLEEHALYGANVQKVVAAELIKAELITKRWYAQKRFYNFETGECTQFCEAFMKMIWSSTRKFGAAIATYGNTTYVVALYNPAGDDRNRIRNIPPAIGPMAQDMELEENRFISKCLEAHNKYRALYGCSPLQLSEQLCEEATSWAWSIFAFMTTLKINGKCPYGVNLFRGESSSPISGDNVVKFWYEEKLKNVFGVAIYSPEFNQIFSKTATHLGVGYVRDGNTTIVVCYYHPMHIFNEICKSPSVPDDTRVLENEIFDAHNKYRRLHGSPKLFLNMEISKFAKQWAQNLAPHHALRHCPGNIFGENILLAQGLEHINGEIVVRTWYEQVAQYNFDSPKFFMNAADFTQLIWASTTDVGVGVVKANDVCYVVCFYYPPGNVNGHFALNVPKRIGSFIIYIHLGLRLCLWLVSNVFYFKKSLRDDHRNSCQPVI